jgi:hypothetical protein
MESIGKIGFSVGKNIYFFGKKLQFKFLLRMILKIILIIFSEVEPVFLVKRSREEILEEIEKLTDPVYLDVLKVQSDDEGEGSNPLTVSSDEDEDEENRRRSKRKKKMRRSKEQKKSKKDPGTITQAEKGPLKLPRSQFSELQGIVGDCVKFGFRDESELAKTQAVLHINGHWSIQEVEGDGNCQFRSILEQLDITPEDDYTVQDLRNQLVFFMASNPEATFLTQAEQIRALYGGKEDGEEKPKDEEEKSKKRHDIPGPFSFKTYLLYMMTDKVWGDQITLMSAAMMWDARITVLNTQGMYILTFKHNKGLPKSDMVLVFNGLNHYSPAG